MAPFWTMKSRNPDWSDRLLVRDVTQPLVYNLQLFLGHLEEEDIFPTVNSVMKTKLLLLY
jgi:hypothetical protein